MVWFIKVGSFLVKHGPLLLEGLRRISKFSDNEIDDNVVNLTDAALACDLDKMEKSALAVLEAVKDKKKKKVG